ncbi:MAG TPA: AI-2E family transporter, partial [Trebonia sp.]|nr:AI-2E family transporter [Trebonia sp.]
MVGRTGKRAADGVAALRAAVRGRLAAAGANGAPADGAAAETALAGGADVTGGAGPASGPGVPAADAALEPGSAAAAVAAGALDAARRADAHPSDVPRWLRVSAAWAWRLLLLAALLWVAGKVASLLYLVIVPFAAAILLTALLQPLEARLRRSGLGALSATWCTLLLAFALIGGAVWLVTTRVEAEYPALVNQVGKTSTQIQSWLASSPFHIRTGNLAKISDNLVKYLSQHRSSVEGAALTGGRIVVELLAGIVLCFFISFFLIKDGSRIWSWLIGGLSPERGRRASLAGGAAWHAVVYYVRGTVVVAAIHAIVMGITL